MRTREEQIAEIEEFCGVLGISNDSPDAEIIEQWLTEAEQRVRAECSEEISSLRNGLSKCAALTNGFASPECSTSFLSENVPEELRLHINHLKAESVRDSERLDWLEKLPLADIHRIGSGWEIGVNHVSFSEGKQTLRDTIDAAREVG